MAELRCPMCSQPNPEELESCRFCGARLKPLVASSPEDSPSIQAGEIPVKKVTSEFEKAKLSGAAPIHAGEVPTPKNTEDLERALPSWLQSLREGEGLAPSEPAAAEAVPASDLPEEPPASQPAEPAGASLDWLAGLDSLAKEEEPIPDWLADLRGPSGASASQPEQPPAPGSGPTQPEADGVDRLGGETAEAPTGQPPSSEPQSQSAESVPEWFSRLDDRPEAGRADEPSPFESSPGLEQPQPLAESLPDWLTTLKEKAAGPADLFTGKEEFPDWLSSLPVEPAQTASPDGEIEPDWLNKLDQKATRSEPELPPALPASDTPDWLSKLQSDGKATTGSQEQVAAFELAEEPLNPEKPAEPLPDWLSGIEQLEPPVGAIPPLTEKSENEAIAADSLAAFAVETPDWLSRLRPERGPETQAPVQGEEPDNLEMSELPSWVQAMRPLESVVSDARSNPPEEGGVAESSGPLAGLRGVLPAGPEITISRKPPAYSVKLQVTGSQQKYAGQLEKMVQEEGQARGASPARLSSNRVWRWVISIILIIAVLLPLVSGVQFTPDLKLFPSEWVNTKALLDGLPDNAPVLVVFDYDPALSGELQAAATPVIDRMLYLGARLTLLSTNPTGPALAAQFLNTSQSYHLQTGMQYANLGYLPGGPAGMYYFASDPQAAAPLTVDGSPAWETASLQDVSQFADFATLVILTDNADTGRAWIEQTQPFIGDTPILMIISAQAEPMLRPYYDSGQIRGLVTGLVGGKTYEQSFGTDGLARHYWDSFGTGTLAAILLITAGGFVGAVQAWRTRKKGEEA